MRYSNAKRTPVHEDTPRYYEWRVQGHPLSVHLSLAVIDRLQTEIMKGFWAVPKRGMEVGGVLIGRVEPGENTVVVIDDREPVSCEHRRGPSYVMSEPDRKRLEKVLRRSNDGMQVVGFYRSHTRLGLYLDQDDMAVIDSYFTDPNNVFLLVRPDATKPGTAGFFIREEGDFHRQSTYLEFPFSSAELLKQSGVLVEESAPAHVAVAPPAETPAPPALAAPSSPRPMVLPALPVRVRRLKWKAAGAIAAGVIAFGALEYRALTYFRRPAVVSADFAPSLSIEPSGGYLQLNWNRNAAAVLKAERGVLSITEGAFRKDLNLDERQLRTGSVVYAPRGNEVNFRLELQRGRTTVSESLRFVSNPPIPLETAKAPQAKPEPEPEPPPPPQVEAKAKTRTTHLYDDGL